MQSTTNLGDRTNEFLSIAQNYQQRQGIENQTKRKGGNGGKSAFTKQAISIAQGIESISKNLEKLTKACQKSSLFDDGSSEIQQLTFLVKQQLHELNKELEELERIHRQQRNGYHKQAISHGESVVDTLKTDLMNTTKEFKKVLQLRTSMIQKQQQRRQQFVAADSPLETTSRENEASSSATTIGNNSSVVIDLGSGSLAQTNRNSLEENHEGNNQALMLQSYQLDNDYRRERAAAAQQIESTILELGQIFQQLATMVSEQVKDILDGIISSLKLECDRESWWKELIVMYRIRCFKWNKVKVSC